MAIIAVGSVLGLAASTAHASTHSIAAAPTPEVPAATSSAPGVPAVPAEGRRYRKTARHSAWSALALTLLCIGGVLLAAGFKGDSRTKGPIGAVIAESGTVTATLTVTGEPRAAATGPPAFGNGARLSLNAVVTEATAKGQRFGANTPVVLLGRYDWAKVKTGNRVATAGRLVPGRAGQDAAALFLAGGAPRILPVDFGWAQWTAELRSRWRLACAWLWPDAAGLLPGMTVGDRTSITSDLDTAMKRVGLTHLTAVSGANCTLILAGLLFATRSLRMPRWLAAAGAAAGLTGFVALVGPDPSVLRAALMGLIGLFALLSGRPRRIPALLAVTIVVLLTVDPWLSGSFAFILSVLAMLGLVLLGKPCARWLSTCLPQWIAQAVAVPLSAQLFCAPVIVLLQPQLTVYSLPANIAAAPVVALVTAAGTLGLPTLLLIPWAAPAFVATAGLGAEWVALAARFFSGLPGAAIPWPAGAVGVALMSFLCVLTVATLWTLLNLGRVATMAAAARGRLPARWQAAVGLPAVAAGAAAVTGVTVWVLSQTGLI
ncbi:ComEC/Rec2 family competence protein [Paenarthrobacter sp. Z7-10]|uniref:ComEC/Rec2 family competence protein n=1 Tax=Paenarthrobacter sp. Z7-10 TaxID=2787635 RepID=UPI0022A8ECEC|nr:ComEC/Rec2 family competence protein [Paenarthrobacter sp. Z7-10]MCZ2402697.1 ComEC/Rec2 family competence protein [Paenarthrobacter sp. Z7-10]